MKNILSTSILALAGMAFLVPAAKADIASNWAEGDLIVAFSTGPTPNHTGNTYLVDFGNISQFQSGGLYATGNPVVVNGASASAYLADLSTAGVTNLNAATWSIFGSDFNQNVEVSRAETTAGVQSIPHAAGSTGNASTDILTLVFNGDTAAAASTAPNSFIQNTTVSNSYAKLNFGSQSATQSFETYANIEGSLSQVLDLYYADAQASGNAQLVGGFTFDKTTGAITFSSDISDFGATAPIPEPGTFAFGFALIGACAMGRFRNRRQAELAA